MRKKLAAALMALTLLSGCASSYTLQELDKDQKACQLGDGRACQMISYDQSAVEQSKAKNTETAITVGAVLLLLPLVVLAAAYGSPPQPDVVVVCRWRC